MAGSRTGTRTKNIDIIYTPLHACVTCEHYNINNADGECNCGENKQYFIFPNDCDNNDCINYKLLKDAIR